MNACNEVDAGGNCESRNYSKFTIDPATGALTNKPQVPSYYLDNAFAVGQLGELAFVVTGFKGRVLDEHECDQPEYGSVDFNGRPRLLRFVLGFLCSPDILNRGSWRQMSLQGYGGDARKLPDQSDHWIADHGVFEAGEPFAAGSYPYC